MIQQPQITSYTSRKRSIRKSSHHTDMWIIEDGKGKFSIINTGTDVMLRMNPPDDVTLRLRVKPINLN
jgi:hypothetical protein